VRIGLVTSSWPLHPGDSRNAGVFVRSFALLLARQGHRVSVLVPRRAGPQGADPELTVCRYGLPEPATSMTHLNVRRPDHALRLGFLMLTGMSAAPWFGKGGRLDHVLAFWAIPSGVFAARAARHAGCPYSVWVLGSDIWKAASYPAGEKIVHRILTGAAQVYADGVTLGNDAAKLCGREVRYLASSRLLPLVPPRMDWGDGREHLLFVGRYHHHKGPDLLLQALELLDQGTLDRIRVHIHGEGPLKAELRERVAASPVLSAVVRFGGILGPEELSASLWACRALLIPSRLESVPVILSDAAQCNTPVICTDAGDVGDLVSRVDAGIVATATDPAGFARAMVLALDRPRKSFEIGTDLLWRELNLETSVERFLAGARAGRRAEHE